jgi:lipoprotein-anchoring transpeptidase ErfK/SrfK
MGRTVQVIGAVILLMISLITVAGTSAETQRGRQPRTRRPPAKTPPLTKVSPLPCGDALAFQVLLDQHGFSPGEIDGTISINTTRALRAFQAARQLTPTGEPDCETWQALGGDPITPATVEFELGEADVAGPFTPRIPRDLPAQANLSELEYQSVSERLAERFHVSPAVLRGMNRDKRLAAGERVLAPAVAPFDPNTKPEHDAAVDPTAIEVSREESALRVTGADGSVVFFAPVSSGSIHDPLPPGQWKVLGTAWRPVFHYNPLLFWDANPVHESATIKGGPNNPVGVVWIALNLEHYGLHGTPEPSRIGATESHGCVRLTNWDATRLASLVKPGTPVVFK